MTDTEEPDVRVIRGGVGTAEDRANYPTPTAVITHRGCQLVIRFADANDTAGAGALWKVEVLPEGETLEARDVRQFVPQFNFYLAYARAAMRILGSMEGSPEERWEEYARSIEPLRQLGGPGRSLPDGFYRRIADNYRDLIADGEKHPVKALAEAHHVTIGAASRWIKGARDRQYLPAKEKSK